MQNSFGFALRFNHRVFLLDLLHPPHHLCGLGAQILHYFFLSGCLCERSPRERDGEQT